jgi:hypothetical protein
MNDPFMLDLAEALADRVAADAASDNPTSRIERLYELALGRPPTTAELDVARRFFADSSDTRTFAMFCHMVLCTNEFIYVD